MQKKTEPKTKQKQTSSSCMFRH